MSAPVVVLASASPARLAVLRAAGVDPVVRVSGVDEDAVFDAHTGASPATVVAALAEAKAQAVAADLAAEPIARDAVVIGCDSMLLAGGRLLGKPHTPERVRQYWGELAGAGGELLTGHAVLRVVDGEVGTSATATRETTVRMADPTAAELSAYLATGEPLEVAGGFTIDGFGGWFIDSITGDPSNVMGLSLPLLRTLLGRLGLSVVDLWKHDRNNEPGPEAAAGPPSGR